MELIKKQVQRAMTTGATPCDSGITGNCYQIIPDLTVDYNFKILLTARDVDFGFFDILIPYGYGYGYGYGYYGEFEGIGESLLMDDNFI